MTETATPLQVETVPWSHGRWRFLADHLERGTHGTQGRHLATEVDAYRRSYPGCRVYLVGHSTGCAVILAAADGLPVDGVDRVTTPRTVREPGRSRVALPESTRYCQPRKARCSRG